MPFRKHFVLVEDLPPELQESLKPWAKSLNEFMEQVGHMKQDLDNISGATPDEKAEMHNALGKVRVLVHYLHSKRFNMTLGAVQAYLALAILKQFGVTPEQVTRFVEAGLKLLERFANS